MNDYPYREFKFISNLVEEEGAILMLLYNMARGLKPKTIVEIGTGNCHTASAWLEALDENEQKDALLYTIDPDPHVPQHFSKHAMFYSYIGKSNIAWEQWDKNKLIDILYIDGDHSYEQCKLDFDNWIQCVKFDGWILIHDTNNHWWPGVARVIQELRNTQQYDMITLPYGYGITIMRRRS